MDPTVNIYWLDKKNTIIKVGSNWDRFALANDGSEIIEDKIIGQPLKTFISGDNSRMWIEAAVMFARAKGGSIEKEYRCDSPQEKRYITMKIVPEENGIIRVEHYITRTKKRKKPIFTEFLPCDNHEPKIPLCRCSICGKIWNQGRWLEPDDDSLQRNEQQSSHSTQPTLFVYYDVCQNCAQSQSDFPLQAD